MRRMLLLVAIAATLALFSGCPKEVVCTIDADCVSSTSDAGPSVAGFCEEGLCSTTSSDNIGDGGLRDDAGHASSPDPTFESRCSLEAWCNYNGFCNPSDDSCACDVGYTGPRCGDCAEGFQDNAGDRSCRPDCEFAALNCGAHGSCSDVTGLARCVCDTDYLGTICDRCEQGLVKQGSACLPPPLDAGVADADAGAGQDAGGA